MELVATIEKIGPKQAKEMLSNNTMNRMIHHSQVRLYARLMKEGKWTLIPAPLVFSDKGDLLQGQHRLNAIVDSGTTQEFLICRGADRSVFPLLDAGLNRSGADALFIEGNFNYPELYASLIYNILRWDSKTFWGHGNKSISPTSIETLEYGTEHKSELALTVNFVKSTGNSGKFFSERMFASSMHIIKKCTNKPEAKVQDFFREICTGREEEVSNAVKWLRNEFLVNKGSRRKLQRQSLFAIIFHAWNNHENPDFYEVDPETLTDIKPQ